MAHKYANARAFANACLTSNVGFVDASNAQFNGQCVALIKNFYNTMTTVPNPFGARGNGKDVAASIINQGFAKRLSAPQAGAVISYPGTANNPYGHVALAISSTEMVEQNSAWLPNNGLNPNGTYKPRVCAIRGGYTTIALPQGYYEDQINNGTVSTAFGGTYKCNVASLNIRTAPSVNGALARNAKGENLVYTAGMTVKLDNWCKIADGYVWGRYTSASGQVRYVAVGPNTGKVEPNKDYLIKQ